MFWLRNRFLHKLLIEVLKVKETILDDIFKVFLTGLFSKISTNNLFIQLLYKKNINMN